MDIPKMSIFVFSIHFSLEITNILYKTRAYHNYPFVQTHIYMAHHISIPLFKPFLPFENRGQ